MKENLVHTIFLQREEGRYHHSYDEELLQYEYIRNGDFRSVEESKRLFRTGINGKLSSDPLRDAKYLFVASTTLATRFAIEGGLEEQEAYNQSDLFIQKADGCMSVAEVQELQTEMIREFTQRIADIRKKNAEHGALDAAAEKPLSKPVQKAMDYIYYHLHEKITLDAVGNAAGRSAHYIATEFKKETGRTVQEYIRSRRIEAAQNMLLYSEYTQSEIAAFLAFSSASHFVKVFREETGMTPRAFVQQNYRRHEKWAARS